MKTEESKLVRRVMRARYHEYGKHYNVAIMPYKRYEEYEKPSEDYFEFTNRHIKGLERRDIVSVVLAEATGPDTAIYESSDGGHNYIIERGFPRRWVVWGYKRGEDKKKKTILVEYISGRSLERKIRSFLKEKEKIRVIYL